MTARLHTGSHLTAARARPFRSAAHLVGERGTFAVHRGFVEVIHNKVTILSDVSESADEIDVARAEQAHLRAAEALKADAEDAAAIAALERAELRLRVAAD